MAKLKAVYAFAKSPQGQLVIHRAVTALVALYVALHRAGV